jgi:hypothetical protein
MYAEERCVTTLRPDRQKNATTSCTHDRPSRAVSSATVDASKSAANGTSTLSIERIYLTHGEMPFADN